jgi:hypothetical protein
MPTLHKAEIEPWRPKADRKPESNPSANPGYLWLENPPPWLEIERGDSAQSNGDAAAAGR